LNGLAADLDDHCLAGLDCQSIRAVLAVYLRNVDEVLGDLLRGQACHADRLKRESSASWRQFDG